MADVAASLKDWSTTEASNSPADATLVLAGLADNFQQVQATVRDVWSRDTIASASTCDIGSKDSGSLTISGTTTITGLGTVSAGIRKWVTFSGALTLTHNATSLILPSSASITTEAGDAACFESLGSGNWKCLVYTRQSGNNVLNAATFADGTLGAPGISYSSDLDTGWQRSGANTVEHVAGGTSQLTVSATTMTIKPAGALNVNSTGATTIRPVAASSPVGITIEAGGSTSATQAAEVVIKGGENTSSGEGGDVHLKPGESSAGNYGDVELWGRGNGSRAVLRINGDTNHIEMVSQGGGDPFISSGGGTSPTISGNDNAFKLTLGTSPGTTAVVVAFGKAWASAPIVIAQYQSDHIALRAVATTTDVTITPASTMATSHVIDVIVLGRASS